MYHNKSTDLLRYTLTTYLPLLQFFYLAKKHGLEEVRSDVVDLVSHAAENRLKTLIEKLSIVAEHRCENPKVSNKTLIFIS